MRHGIPISGKDSLTTAIVQRERQPDLDYEYFYNETGAELPDTALWLLKAETYLNKPILRIGDNLEDIIQFNGILPSIKVRFCTRESKIEPMENHFSTDDVTVYYGLRADEPQRVGYERRKKKGAGANIIASYPLREEGYTLSMVWARLAEIDLLPPSYFWQHVYDRVVIKLDTYAPMLDTLKPWEHRQLFAWRSRDNCYFCFNQRLYEWVGLFDTYPDLFWYAVEIEETTGAKDFTFNSAKSLRTIADEAERIREKRVDAIVKMVTGHNNISMFQDEGTFTLLDTISCGLLCGK